MRAADRAEIESSGRVPLLALRSLYRRSLEPPKVALVDGAVAAVWGFEGGLLGAQVAAWLFTAPAVEKLPLAFFRETRREVAAIAAQRGTVISQVHEDYTAALRFFTLLGFELGEICVAPSGARYRMIIARRG